MRRPRRRLLRWLLTLAVLLVLASLLTATGLLRGSLPRLDGERALPGLSAPVAIERDSEGLATVSAADRTDLARALGWLHAQERYFEMDLSRRSAAGELADLFGARALPLDRRHRVHRFRSRAQRWWSSLPEHERSALNAYTEGVNAGLADLRVRPWPYLLLRQSPQPWRGEDSLLVVLAMFFDLQDGESRRERQLDFARRHLQPSAFAFIARAGSSWDAPLTGSALPEPAVPTPEALDLRRYPPVPAPAIDSVVQANPELPGSNNFAVAGRLTAHGRALVANDMHLGLRAPNIWFRARLIHGVGEQRVQVEGVTLPGVPAVVVGSNGHIAWAFTNSYGDWLDLVRLHVDADAPQRYRTASGWREFERIEERIAVAGGDDEILTVKETIWGPVIASDDQGAPLALAWTAHRDGAVNTELLALEHAREVDSALNIAARAGIPGQNFVVGDAHGHIGWTLAGRIPQRQTGHDPSQPIDSATLAGDIWQGWLEPAAYPRLVDPESGRIWTANGRVVDGEALAVLGDGGYDNGARAAQIRDGLLAREQFAEADLLAIQLDHRALFLERWWRLLREVLTQAGADPDLAELAAATAHWDGCACIDSAAYRLVRAFRGYVHETVMRGLAAPLLVKDKDYTWPRLGQNEGVVWQLLRERPAHLLPPPHANWDALLRTQALRVVAALSAPGGGLAARTWGEANTVRIRHPLSAALPSFIGQWLDMPAQPLPGDSHMPRVQGVRFGASQRLVVAPGREAQAILHMPGGSSGHPLSPYYGAGHQAWAQGDPTALPPGAVRWRLNLVP